MKSACATMALALAVTAQSTPGLGQQVQDDQKRTADSRDIVVTGKRDGPDDTFTQIRVISNAHHGQLARFETPVCPTVVGLPQDHIGIVEKRIRWIADQADIRLAKPGCKPNLTIVIAGDGPSFVDRLYRKSPNLFGSLELHELDRLLQSRGPSWTWQSVVPKRRDGGPIETINQLQLGGGPPQSVSKGASIVNNAQFSRLSVSVRQETDLAFVVLSGTAIVGLTLQQIADYSAMVGLAAIQTDRTDIQARSSILTMFQDVADGRPGQPHATAFDIAYLTSLYGGGSGFSSEQKSAAMAIQIDRSTKRSSDVPKSR